MRIRKRTRHIALITLCFAMVLLFPGSIETIKGNSKFEGKEDYWNNYCKKVFANADEAKDCFEYKAYLTEKGNNLGTIGKEIDAKIAALKGDIQLVLSEAETLGKELGQINEQIEALETQIKEMEQQVVSLQEEIEKNEKKIAKKDEDIKARMVNSQSFVNTNGYIDFIMGAKDFTDLLERISVMDQITNYENDQIKALNKDIKALDQDRKEVERQQELLDAQKKDVEVNKAILEEKKRYQDALLVEYQKKEADLINEQMQNEAYMNEIINSIPKIEIGDDVIPPSSGGWGAVVSGYRSAGTWYYSGGGFHPGLDLAGPVGSPISAPINGVIGYTKDGYPTYGAIGSPLGYANMIVMIGEVNGRTYGVLFGHLEKGGVAVTPGQVVSQGQVIGYRGSSGNSSGPHTHVEIFDLGTVGINGGLHILQTRGYNFGQPYSEASKCGSAPCRVRPENYIPY